MDRQICCWIIGEIPVRLSGSGFRQETLLLSRPASGRSPGRCRSDLRFCRLRLRVLYLLLPNWAQNHSAKSMWDDVTVTTTTALFPLLWSQGAFVSSGNAVETETPSLHVTNVLNFMHAKDLIKNQQLPMSVRLRMCAGWEQQSTVPQSLAPRS